MDKTLLKIGTIKSNQTIIINGIPQVMENTVLYCDSCKKVVQQFEQFISIKDVIKILEHNPDIQENIKYCSKCGKKLIYPTLIEIESN